MRALVTGGAGFIGSSLVKALAARGVGVTCFDALTYAGRRASIAQETSTGAAELIVGNICDAAAVRQALEAAQPTHLFHLAAETHVDRSIDGPAAFLSTNIIGTSTLLEACRDYAAGRTDFRFIHVSTDEVFGELGPAGRFTVDSAYAPRSPYAASKAASDHLVRAWGETYGLAAIITNCSNNFGPRQFPEKLIPLMILKALAGDDLPVYGAGNQVRDWLHVDDHARALIAVAEAGRIGATYLVGAEQERSNLEVVHAVCALMDERRPARAPHARLIKHVDDRPGHDFRYAIDPSVLRDELGWAPRHDFAAGLSETVDWYLANEDWWRPILDGTYHGERLGAPP